MPKSRKARVDNSATGDISHQGKNIFFAAVETTRMPMLVTDPSQPDNPIIFANNAFIEMTGYQVDELIGQNCRFLQGPETDRAVVSQIREAVEQKRELSVEIINYRKDGSTFWNALFISPVYNDAGELIYFFASQLDVSRRRDAEDALRQAQKMEALGQLTGGIAHDFNNLLQVMMGYIDIIQRTAEKPSFDQERILRSATHAKSAAERASTLTQQLLAFSRKQKLEGRVLNLNNLIRTSHELAERTLGDVEIRTQLDPHLWNCRIDPTQSEVALLNILINARDALADRRKPSVGIETRNVEVRELANMSYDGLMPGRYVSLAITDNGHGMPASIRDRVMDPFFPPRRKARGRAWGCRWSMASPSNPAGRCASIRKKTSAPPCVCISRWTIATSPISNRNSAPTDAAAPNASWWWKIGRMSPTWPSWCWKTMAIPRRSPSMPARPCASCARSSSHSTWCSPT